jgi:hypothetical protein
LALAIAGSVGFSAWIYFHRELPISGRRTLAGLRALTLVLVLLLLWNPRLPVGGEAPTANVPWILIDASVSMTAVVSGSQTSAWAEAMDRVEELASGETHLATFGGPSIEHEPAMRDSLVGLAARRPELPSSFLGPALDQALDAGASRIAVISDMRISDEARVRGQVATSPVPIRFVTVGGTAYNAGIGRFEAPPSVSRGDSIPLEFTVISEGVTDSLEVRVLEEGRLVRVVRVGPASGGREAVVRLSVTPPDESGPVRYSAEVVLAGDDFTLDDRRDVLVEVDPGAGGLVLVSFAPDWEPRFLLPVLEQVTGLTPHGYIRLGDGRFLTLESGPGGGGVRALEEVRRRVEGAELLVVHGASATLPRWVAEAARSAGRAVIFAVDAEGASTLGPLVDAPRTGEWYPSSDPTPSALAGRLVDLNWSSLPPLSGLLRGVEPLEGDVPLRIRLRGSGPAEPAMVLNAVGIQRRVTVLSTGYWRWAFRPGATREAYRRLWSAVGGWLLANEPLSGGPGVRPMASVVTVGAAQDWSAGNLRGEDIHLTIRSGEDALVDTTVTVGESGTFALPGMPEGDYTYLALGGDDVEAGSGRFLVGAHGSDRGVPVTTLAGTTGATAAAAATTTGLGVEGSGISGPRGRPLRTQPLVYLLVLVLLSAEWVLRRRRGLR